MDIRLLKPPPSVNKRINSTHFSAEERRREAFGVQVESFERQDQGPKRFLIDRSDHFHFMRGVLQLKLHQSFFFAGSVNYDCCFIDDLYFFCFKCSISEVRRTVTSVGHNCWRNFGLISAGGA